MLFRLRVVKSIKLAVWGFRREYQVRNHTLFDYRNQFDIPIAYEKLSMLADELIESQTEEYEFFNFSKFHPDKI